MRRGQSPAREIAKGMYEGQCPWCGATTRAPHGERKHAFCGSCHRGFQCHVGGDGALFFVPGTDAGEYRRREWFRSDSGRGRTLWVRTNRRCPECGSREVIQTQDLSGSGVVQRECLNCAASWEWDTATRTAKDQEDAT